MEKLEKLIYVNMPMFEKAKFGNYMNYVNEFTFQNEFSILFGAW